MPLRGRLRIGASANLSEIKAISGWFIEKRRRQADVSQESLAAGVGVTSRWIREIEGGNPKATLDDHLRCAEQLDISIGYMMLPMLYLERQISYPRELLFGDIEALENACMTAVTDRLVQGIHRTLSSPSSGR